MNCWLSEPRAGLSHPLPCTAQAEAWLTGGKGVSAHCAEHSKQKLLQQSCKRFGDRDTEEVTVQ